MTRVAMAIFFLLLLTPLVLYASDEEGFSGDSYIVKGVVRWYGKTPPKKELSKVPYDDLCGKKPKSLIEFSYKRIKDVAVWLAPAVEGDLSHELLGARPWEGGEKGGRVYAPAGLSEKGLVITEDGCEFEPRVSIVPSGTEIEVVNIDRKDHWLVVRGKYIKKADKVEEYGSGWPEFTFKTPHVVKIPAGGRYNVYTSGPDVIFLQSGFHHWMQGFVVAMSAGHTAVTNSRGEFVFEGVEPGEYYLHAWHPFLGDSVQKISIPHDIRKAAKVQVSYSKLLPAEHEYLEPTIPSINREVRETHIDEIDP